MEMDAVLLRDGFGDTDNHFLAVGAIFTSWFKAQFFEFSLHVLAGQIKFRGTRQATLHAVVGEIGDVAFEGLCGYFIQRFFQVFGQTALAPTGGNQQATQ